MKTGKREDAEETDRNSQEINVETQRERELERLRSTVSQMGEELNSESQLRVNIQVDFLDL